MASQVPIIRQTNWYAVVPQLVALFIAVIIGYTLDAQNGFVWGALAYLSYSQVSRRLIARAHRAGIRLTKQGAYAAAIPHFQESYAFFDRHPWLDRFRSVVMFSASAASYREMALANTAFCYTQLGKGVEGREYYEKCLALFPSSVLASSALRMLNSVASTGANPTPLG